MNAINVGFRKRRVKFEVEVDGAVEERCMNLVAIEVSIAMPWGEIKFKSSRTAKGWGRWKDLRPGQSCRKDDSMDLTSMFKELVRLGGPEQACDALVQIASMQNL